MEHIYRLLVEKKPAHAQEARHLLVDLREHLSLHHLTELRRFIRYDISGITPAVYQKALPLVFTDPPVDQYTQETLPAEVFGDQWITIAWEYLPGQYDQRADSAEEALQIIEPGSTPHVQTGWITALRSRQPLTPDEIQALKKYLINPVDSREAPSEKPATLEAAYPPAPDVPVMEGFCSAGEEALAQLRRRYGLAMSAEDILHCRNYFRDEEKRDPSETEIRLLDTYWSDHCRHTTFLSPLTEVTWEEAPGTEPVRRAWESFLAAREELGRGEKPVTLMEIATMGMRYLRRTGKLENLEETREINACSIVIPVDLQTDEGERQEEWLLMFKNETHNHPTEIEPFGGAATCLGGAIRDPLSGRSYVYQAMRITGSGDPRQPLDQTLPGKLPQRKITREAARGYSSYGNQIGLATGLVREIYHPGYVAKRMEIGAVIAAAPRHQVFRGEAKPGDVIIVTGGRTGRDGCGGATGSSKEHTQESITSCGAEVQKGNPPTERKLQRLFRNPEASRLIKVCNDFGAGGVSVAIGELAEGLDIDLDALPKKYDGLNGTELAISESQERMAVVVSPDQTEAFMALARAETLEAVPAAKVTDTGRVRMIWRGKILVDLSRAFIDTNGVLIPRKARITAPARTNPFPLFPGLSGELMGTGSSDGGDNPPWREKALALLGSIEIASQKGLGETFDSTIGAGTILMPYGGASQTAPADVMAAFLPVLGGETTTAAAMSWGYHPEIMESSPFHGAAWAVTESAARLIAAGARREDIRLTLQEYFERLGDDPVKWGKPLAALLGAWEAQKALETAAIGGKDSMSGTFEDRSVPPTLVSFSAAPLKAARIRPWEFQKPGSRVFYLPPARTAEGLPDYPLLISQWTALSKLLDTPEILSVRTTEKGGLTAALTKSCLGNTLGFRRITAAQAPPLSQEELFGLLPGGILLEVEPAIDPTESFPGLLFLGETTAEPELNLSLDGGAPLSLTDALKTWSAPLEDVFPPEEPVDTAQNPPVAPPKGPAATQRPRRRTPRIARPRVIIPVFPGTNCEYDSARAFSRAGALPQTLVFNNLTPGDIKESLRSLAAAIRRSQILMIPGGFSAGDEPDGSGKFIASVFRNPEITDAVTDLLDNRDGLILGICNGFQALVKLGLVPWGRITAPGDNDPTLTFNTVGRHISRMAETEVLSTRSPWLSRCEPGDIHRIPLSHGEGRFYAPREDLEKWNTAGQVATIYRGTNPNGSAGWVEGLTSPDGRVLGKMGHSERQGPGRHINIPGPQDQQIFEGGTSFFTG